METKLDAQELARLERNRYHREWRKKNPDKVRETNRRYWERKAIQLAAREKADKAGTSEADHNRSNQ